MKLFQPKPKPTPTAPATMKASAASQTENAALLQEVQRRRLELEARLAAIDERLAVVTRGQYEP